MTEPILTSDVKVLDPNYRTVATGTIGWGVDPDDKTVTGVLNLSGDFQIRDMALAGAAEFFVLRHGELVTMGTNAVFTGQSGDAPLYIMLTSWGDGGAVLGYFVYGQDAPESSRPHVITT